MKKILLLLGILVLGLAVVSCGSEDEETKTEHQHQVVGTWKSDDSQHWYECSCGEKMNVAAHIFGEWNVVKEATTAAAGEKERSCEICSYVDKEEIPQLQHEHEKTNWQHDATSHWIGCSSCSEKFDVADHTFGQWEVIEEATETTEGKQQRTCSICYYVAEEIIPVKEHEHKTSTNYVTDDENHWKACSGCDEKIEYGQHEYVPNVVGSKVTYKCEICKKEVVDSEPYKLVGYFVDKTWSSYEKFTVFAKRNSDSITVRFISENSVFLDATRDSQIELYFVVGNNLTGRENNEGVTQIIITNKGNLTVHNYGKSVSSTGVNYKIEGKASTVVEVEVPYSLIGAEADGIFGLSCGLWSNTDADWAPITALVSGELSAVENLTTYVRCDKENTFFISPINDYKENVVEPDYNKDELIEGYRYGIANPLDVKDEHADDIYLRISKTETQFVFEMIGFGSFEDNEYIKLILHTSEVDGVVWAIQESDVTFLISKNVATIKTNQTDFWSYVNFGENDEYATNTPVYTLNELGYFTLSFAVEFTEIPEYSSDVEVSFIALEFWGGNIYNGDPWNKAMTVDGVGIGDPALQSSYQVIKEKDLSVNKEEIIAGYNYKFSTNYYAKVVKAETSVKVSLVSFNPLASGSFIRMVIDTDGTPVNGGWSLDANDVSFMIHSDKVYFATGQTSFWADENLGFHRGEEALYQPVYVDHGEYWTIEFEIDYSELGLNIDQNSPLTAMLVAFAPTIENHGFDYDGMIPGDIAIQSNYFVIK